MAVAMRYRCHSTAIYNTNDCTRTKSRFCYSRRCRQEPAKGEHGNERLVERRKNNLKPYSDAFVAYTLDAVCQHKCTGINSSFRSALSCRVPLLAAACICCLSAALLSNAHTFMGVCVCVLLSERLLFNRLLFARIVESFITHVMRFECTSSSCAKQFFC